MRLIRVPLWAWATVSALSVLSGCTTVVTGSAVKALDQSEFKSTVCQQISTPLTSIDPQNSGEPQLRIPQPSGWERTTRLDSELIRFASVNKNLISHQFAPSAVVTLESAPGTTADQEQILDQERTALTTTLGATDVTTTATTLCGYRAELLAYTAPVMGEVPARRATTLEVIAAFGDRNYVATLTVQSTDPDNPTYARDKQTMLTGFQMLPPEAP